MTITETTTHDYIGKQLVLLQLYRHRASKCEHGLRWIDELSRGLSSAKQIKVACSLRRDHTRTADNESYLEIALPHPAYGVALLLAKEHWQRMIPPLEAWLDARNIEHVEAAKAD